MNLQSTYQWLMNQSQKQRAMFISALLLIIILTVFAIYWIMTPHYVRLFSHLEPQDCAKITQKLDEQKVSWKLADHDKSILVPAHLVDSLRMRLMSTSLDLTGHVGFELFDQSDFGMTDFSRKINFQRALQGELERTISSLNEVIQARVHLVIPEEHLFKNEQNPPQAAVTVKLKHPLKPAQIRSIQQLIATSVPKLTSAHITIVDNHGNNLLPEDPSDLHGHLNMKKETEHYLHQKLTSMLEHILPNQPFSVMIDVRLNYDEVKQEVVKPELDGKVTHEKRIEHAKKDKTGKNKLDEDVNIERDYQFGTKKERLKRASGTIERLSISVALPSHTPQSTCERIERLLKATSGFDEKRGDDISVEAVIETPQEPSVIESLPSMAFTPHPQGIYPALLLLLVTLVGFCIWLWWQKQKARERLVHEIRQWLNEDEHEPA